MILAHTFMLAVFFGSEMTRFGFGAHAFHDLDEIRLEKQTGCVVPCLSVILFPLLLPVFIILGIFWLFCYSSKPHVVEDSVPAAEAQAFNDALWHKRATAAGIVTPFPRLDALPTYVHTLSAKSSGCCQTATIGWTNSLTIAG